VHADSGTRIRSIAGRPDLSREQETVPYHYTGMQVIEPEILEAIPPGKPWEMNAAVYPALIRQGAGVHGFVTSWDWFDFGTPADFLNSNFAVLSALDRLPFNPGEKGRVLAAAEPRGREDIEKGDVLPERGLGIIRGIIAGHGTTVREGAVLEESILFENVEIGRRCTVIRSIIGPGVKMPSGMEVRSKILIQEAGGLKEFELA